MNWIDFCKNIIRENILLILFVLIISSLISAYIGSQVTIYSFSTLASVAGVFSSGMLTLALAHLYSLQNTIAERQLELESQPFLQIRLLNVSEHTIQVEICNKGRDIARKLRIQADVATDDGRLLQNQEFEASGIRVGNIRPTASSIEPKNGQEISVVEYMNEMIEAGETSIFEGKTHLIMKEKTAVPPDGEMEEMDTRFIPWITELYNEYNIERIHFRISIIYTDSLDRIHSREIITGRSNLENIENVEELIEESRPSDKITEDDVVVSPSWES